VLPLPTVTTKGEPAAPTLTVRGASPEFEMVNDCDSEPENESVIVEKEIDRGATSSRAAGAAAAFRTSGRSAALANAANAITMLMVPKGRNPYFFGKKGFPFASGRRQQLRRAPRTAYSVQ